MPGAAVNTLSHMHFTCMLAPVGALIRVVWKDQLLWSVSERRYLQSTGIIKDIEASIRLTLQNSKIFHPFSLFRSSPFWFFQY